MRASWTLERLGSRRQGIVSINWIWTRGQRAFPQDGNRLLLICERLFIWNWILEGKSLKCSIEVRWVTSESMKPNRMRTEQRSIDTHPIEIRPFYRAIQIWSRITKAIYMSRVWTIGAQERVAQLRIRNASRFTKEFECFQYKQGPQRHLPSFHVTWWSSTCRIDWVYSFEYPNLESDIRLILPDLGKTSMWTRSGRTIRGSTPVVTYGESEAPTESLGQTATCPLLTGVAWWHVLPLQVNPPLSRYPSSKHDVPHASAPDVPPE